jgi:predicted Zn-dependent peptidase
MRFCGASMAALALAAVWLVAPSIPASALVLDPRTIRSATLGNGLRLIVCEEPTATVTSVELVVRVGSADDPPGEEGTAHLLEHLCWGGHPKDDPRLHIEEVGGVANAGTLRDLTRFYATVPAGEATRALRAVADMAFQVEFDERALARERAVIAREALNREEQPRALLNDAAFDAVYGDTHPYGRPIEGDEHSRAGIGAAKLMLFHRTWYVPNNVAVVVSGRVTFAEVLAEVRHIFGQLAPAALPLRAAAAPPRPAPAGERAVYSEGREAYVMAAFVGPAGAEHKQVCASDLLATLLSHGSWGRLPQRLKETENLARAVGVDFLTQRDRALFGVWAVCDPAKVGTVKDAIRGELARVAAGPIPADELAIARRLLTTGYAFANEIPADRAATLGFYEAVDSYRFASQYLSWVRSLTAADVAEVAGWYAVDPVWVVLTPGAAEK